MMLSTRWKLLIFPSALVVGSNLTAAFIDGIQLIALALELIAALAVGYMLIRSESTGSLMRCAQLGAVIGLIQFVAALPIALIRGWGDVDFGRAFLIFLVVSGVNIALLSAFSMIGGTLRRMQSQPGTDHQ